MSYNTFEVYYKNYCSNCGNKLEKEQDVCLSCGKFLSYEKNVKNRKGHVYSITTGIITLILGLSFIVSIGYVENNTNMFYMYLIMGIFSFASGIFSICSKNIKPLLLISGILLFLGTMVNVIMIKNISLFAIHAIVIGILNVIFSQKKRHN